jgi:regulator of sigma E protease
VPTQTLGLGFAMGPISAIRAGSLAETAGIKVGDVIESVDGQPVVDALRLPMDVAEKNGKPLVFKVGRPGNTESLSFTLTSDQPPSFGTIGGFSAQCGLDTYGIAYEVSPKVSYVDPDADKASSFVKVGDELTQFKLELTPEQIDKYSDTYFEEDVVTKTRAITPQLTIPYYFSSMQKWPGDIQVRCYLKRNEEVREVVLPLHSADDWYWVQRGIVLKALHKIQQTDDASQALSWGFVETGRRLREVFEFLTMLVTGRAKVQHLAGPLEIAKAAASEASNSPSRLLLFLTLLSANLAILNFLPIPALDGGHLMFLIAEAIRGKPLNEALQVRLTMVGVVCLLGLMAFVLLNDILRNIM